MHTYKIISNQSSVIIERYKGAVRVEFETFKKGELKARASATDVRISQTEGYAILGDAYLRIPYTGLTIEGATTSAEKEAKFADESFLLTAESNSVGAGSSTALVEDWTGAEQKLGQIKDKDGNLVDYFRRSREMPGDGTSTVLLLVDSGTPADVATIHKVSYRERTSDGKMNMNPDPAVSAPNTDSFAVFFKGGNISFPDHTYLLSIEYTKVLTH